MMGSRHRYVVGLAIASLGLAVAACDPIRGVQTNADLTKPVDLDCIDRTIRTVPRVGLVSHWNKSDESFQIVPYRGKVITISDQWRYGPDATVQITHDGQNWTYFNGLLKMGEPLPAAKLDAFVPMMNQVNAALESGCGLPLASEAKITRN